MKSSFLSVKVPRRMIKLVTMLALLTMVLTLSSWLMLNDDHDDAATGQGGLIGNLTSIPDVRLVGAKGDVKDPSDTLPDQPNVEAFPGDGQVVLTWDNVSHAGSTVTNYNIYRGLSSGSEQLLISVGPVETYTNTGLTNGETYYYQVSANSSAGEGDLSDEVSATPIGPPTAPTNLVAEAGDGYVFLTWDAPSDDGSSPITNYQIWRNTSTGDEVFYGSIGTERWFNDTAVANGQTYYYVVKAENAVGAGPSSNEAFGTPATVPSAPTLISATASSGQVILTWIAPANGGATITNYRVYRGTVSGTEVLLVTLGNVLTHTDTGLSNGVTYFYRISAINSAGEGALSNELSARPVGLSTEVRSVQATPGNNFINLTWLAPAIDGGSAITNYQIWRSTTSGSETFYQNAGLRLWFNNTGLTNEVRYYYIVKAVNAQGIGPDSNEVSAVPSTTAIAPTQPLNVVATAGDSQVHISWSVPANNGGSAITGYTVYRSTISGGETLLVTLGNVLAYTDLDCINSVTYYYTVSATNAVGESPSSTEVSATPATVPTAPQVLNVVPGLGLAELSWSIPAYTGPGTIMYHVFRDGVEVWSGVQTEYTDTALSKGVEYSYMVCAQNAIGYGPNSTTSLTTPFGVPDEPWGLSAVPGNGQISLSWNVVNYSGPGTLTYHLYRNGSFLWSGISLAYKDMSVVNGVNYTYYVVAENDIGFGQESGSITVSPSSSALEPPGVPNGLIADTGDGKVTLVWGAPMSSGSSTITGYNVYRGNQSGALELIATVTGTSYVDDNLTNGQNYYYQVAAVSEAGESELTAELMATPGESSNGGLVNDVAAVLLLLGASLGVSSAAVVGTIWFFRWR